MRCFGLGCNSKGWGPLWDHPFIVFTYHVCNCRRWVTSHWYAFLFVGIFVCLFQKRYFQGIPKATAHALMHGFRPILQYYNFGSCFGFKVCDLAELFQSGCHIVIPCRIAIPSDNIQMSLHVIFPEDLSDFVCLSKYFCILNPKEETKF